MTATVPAPAVAQVWRHKMVGRRYRVERLHDGEHGLAVGLRSVTLPSEQRQISLNWVSPDHLARYYTLEPS